MYERRPLKTLKARLQEPRKFIQVLMGPRQVGLSILQSLGRYYFGLQRQSYRPSSYDNFGG